MELQPAIPQVAEAIPSLATARMPILPEVPPESLGYVELQPAVHQVAEDALYLHQDFLVHVFPVRVGGKGGVFIRHRGLGHRGLVLNSHNTTPLLLCDTNYVHRQRMLDTRHFASQERVSVLNQQYSTM